MKKVACLPALLVAVLFACNSNPGPSSMNGSSAHNLQVPVTADPPLDKSGMDMSYFPPEYPQLKMTGKAKGEPVIRIIYSRPHKDGRKILGDVLQFDSPWRLGANEATEIEFFRDVTIQGKSVSKGRYVLYAIPRKEKWKMILNGDLFTWGLKIDKSKDLFTFELPMRQTSIPMEVFSMQFGKTAAGCELTVAWDTMLLALPINF